MRTLILLFILLNCFTTHSQIFPPTRYPQGYFRSPLDIPISLAGNFGELRPNHYHMGFDLKTEHRENLPVHAAADGYIARIKIEPAGFGRAIYINHPNGFTTVYGHLNAFIPAVDKWLKQQQYRQESWRVFLEVPANLFPVKKGDLIAYSGNTGGSEGPHLHFEIRTTNGDVNLNPALFGLPLSDDTRPTISRLALYNRAVSMYEQSPTVVPIKKSGIAYTSVAEVVTVPFSKVSFALSASDTHTGSTNPNGVFEAGLYDNNKPIVAFRMGRISYNNTRNINAHIDYKTKATGGPYLQQLFRLPGYLNSIYKSVDGDGMVDLSDGQVHAIRIYVKDASGNASTLNFNIKSNGNVPAQSVFPGKLYYPLMLDGFESPSCEFYFGEHSLFDAVHIAYAEKPATSPAAVSPMYSIGAAYIPIQDSIMVRILPGSALTDQQRKHLVMQRTAGRKSEVQKVQWQKQWAAARFREMGNFQLIVDEDPPAIVPIGFRNDKVPAAAHSLVFTVKDNLGSFNSFRAELDGHWIRFTNDKGQRFIYIFDERCPPGMHSLKISVADEAGNVAEKTYTFTR